MALFTSWDCSIIKVTRLGMNDRGSIPCWGRDFFTQRPDRLWAHPPLYPLGIGGERGLGMGTDLASRIQYWIRKDVQP